MHIYIFILLFLLLPQDGKTAEDLASTDQHEHIISLLGKLKKVKQRTHTHTILCLLMMFEHFFIT